MMGIALAFTSDHEWIEASFLYSYNIFFKEFSDALKKINLRLGVIQVSGSGCGAKPDT